MVTTVRRAVRVLDLQLQEGAGAVAVEVPPAGEAEVAAVPAVGQRARRARSVPSDSRSVTS